MNATALVVSPDGTATFTPITGLSGMRAAVGGDIEAFPIPLDLGVAAYGNEQAKLIGMERNVNAHRILDAIGWQAHPNDYPTGPIAFFGLVNTHSEDGWMETDVPQSVLDIAARFRVTVTGERA